MTTSIVPRHKQDFERADALVLLADRDIEPALAELIEWTFDSNWPIAATVSEALFHRPITVPAIERVLGGADGDAKWHVVSLIIQHMPKTIAVQLRPMLQKLVDAPSFRDRHEEVDDIARDALAWLASSPRAD